VLDKANIDKYRRFDISSYRILSRLPLATQEEEKLLKWSTTGVESWGKRFPALALIPPRVTLYRILFQKGSHNESPIYRDKYHLSTTRDDPVYLPNIDGVTAPILDLRRI
jgi:hypothetical protein